MLDYLTDVNLQHGHHSVRRLEDNVVMFFQTTENPDDLLQKRIVVLKGVLISEEIYLTELETLLTVKWLSNRTFSPFVFQRTFINIIFWPKHFLNILSEDSYFTDVLNCEL